MTKVKYVGPHDQVDVPAADISVKKGEVVDVSTEIAEGLLIQDTWRRPGRKSTKKES